PPRDPEVRLEQILEVLLVPVSLSNLGMSLGPTELSPVGVAVGVGVSDLRRRIAHAGADAGAGRGTTWLPTPVLGSRRDLLRHHPPHRVQHDPPAHDVSPLAADA